MATAPHRQGRPPVARAPPVRHRPPAPSDAATPTPPGEQSTLLSASANRAEVNVSNPDPFCPNQNASQNLLYGAGIHICPGAPLARMELRVFMEELLKQVDAIEPVAGEPPERAMFPTGGFNALPLVFR